MAIELFLVNGSPYSTAVLADTDDNTARSK